MNLKLRKRIPLLLSLLLLVLLNSCMLAAIRSPDTDDMASRFERVELKRTSVDEILDRFGIPDAHYQSQGTEYMVYYFENGYFYAVWGEYSKDEVVFKFVDGVLLGKKKQRVSTGWGLFFKPFDFPEVSRNQKAESAN